MGFLQKLSSVFHDKRELLDPRIFNDEVALAVSWMPLVGGGTSFCTHRLTITKGLSSSSTLAFKATFLVYLNCSLFIVGGLTWLFAVAIPNTQSGQTLDAIAPLIPVGFLAFGIWSLWSTNRQVSAFDFSLGQFTKGSDRYRLEEVHSLQLIREYVGGNKRSYYSYELNIVFHSANRLNIVDHGSLRNIREDASKLGHYLQVPIWDAIDYKIPMKSDMYNIKADTLFRNFGL